METKVDVTSVTTALYNLLQPLEPVDRKRVIQAAQMLLGDVDQAPPKSADPLGSFTADNDLQTCVHPRVRMWLQKYGLNDEAVSQVFHIEKDAAEIIAADVPGKSGREKAINAYLLIGARNYLLNGEFKFDDKSAREACKALGCYSDTNHATYIKDKGNLISGSKTAGWVLTGPGQKAVADLIKNIATS